MQSYLGDLAPAGCIDQTLESAARVFGANTFRIFWHILIPLLLPGILAAVNRRLVNGLITDERTATALLASV